MSNEAASRVLGKGVAVGVGGFTANVLNGCLATLLTTLMIQHHKSSGWGSRRYRGSGADCYAVPSLINQILTVFLRVGKQHSDGADEGSAQKCATSSTITW